MEGRETSEWSPSSGPQAQLIVKDDKDDFPPVHPPTPSGPDCRAPARTMSHPSLALLDVYHSTCSTHTQAHAKKYSLNAGGKFFASRETRQY
ncbi:MAG: hypothetical protein Q9182_002308 [Xanthomendoza sp. 2 TL-2023]